jgi:hypothetical protein
MRVCKRSESRIAVRDGGPPAASCTRLLPLGAWGRPGSRGSSQEKKGAYESSASMALHHSNSAEVGFLNQVEGNLVSPLGGTHFGPEAHPVLVLAVAEAIRRP